MKFTGKDADEDLGNEKKPVFVNNLMHSLFQNVDISLNGIPVSSANNLYPYKALVEAELLHNASCNEGWLRYQGFKIEKNPRTFPGQILFKPEKAWKKFTSKWNLFGTLRYICRKK